MMSRLLAGLLVLGVLAAVPAIAKEQAAPSVVPAHAGGSDQLSKRLEISTELLEALNARLAAAAALAEVDATIAELAELLTRLQQERHEALVYEKDLRDVIKALSQDLAQVEQEIESVKDEIDSLPWLPGEISSVLAAKRATLESDLDALRAKRSALQDEISRQTGELKKTEQNVVKLDQLIAATKAKREEAQAKKQELLQQQTEVAITAPAEGARLLVGNSARLRLRSLYPPTGVRIEIERRDFASPPEARQAKNAPQRLIWKPFYAATWEWQKLESAGPLDAILVFDTGRSDRQLVQAGAGARPRLPIGEYRARIPSSAAGWRSFSVVGRLDAADLEKGPLVKPAQVQPGVLRKPQGQPASGATKEPAASTTGDQVAPSILRQPAAR